MPDGPGYNWLQSTRRIGLPTLRGNGDMMVRMVAKPTRIRDYKEVDAPAIARLFYETVHSVNRADYSEEQVRAWALGPVFTEASVTARPFFERQGFRVLGERRVLRLGVELTNFAMEKILPPTNGEAEQG